MSHQPSLLSLHGRRGASITAADLARMGVAASAPATSPADSFIFTMRLPPRLNAMYANRQHGKGRGRILSKEARQWKDAVATLLLSRGVRPIRGDASVSIDIFNSAADVDAYGKIVLDSLTGVAYHDDRQVKELRSRRRDDDGESRIEVTVGSVSSEGGSKS
jgi:crossover junction endodeoxyribonuclease RusA